MGTPHFAVPSLNILVENGFDVVGVITAVDKPKGRGQKLVPSPVKQYALDKGLNVLQPKNLKAPAFIEELKALKADLQIVVAFRMLPAVVFEMPPKGTVNLHASLLPQYRGAAPINWAIINGEQETGMTTFFIEQQIDTGELIYQESIDIPFWETAGELHDRMMEEGAELVLKTAKAIEKGNCPRLPQKIDGELKKAPKIFKADCEINWNQSVGDIYNHIRGLSPYPAAYTILKNNRFKIYQCHFEYGEAKVEPGTIDTDNKTYLKVAGTDGFIHINELQLAGKKRMETKQFLAGFNF